MTLMKDVFDREFARLEKNDAEFRRLDKKLKDDFLKRRLETKDFVPATKNIGRFDTKYEPRRNLLTITVNLSFAFRIAPNAGQQPAWTANEMREFKVKGTYDGVFPQLRAGMNCRVTVHADSIPDAIQVPVIAVFLDKGEHCCYVEPANGAKPEKRPVKIGVSNGSVVQIESGLKAGDTVLLRDPNRDSE